MEVGPAEIRVLGCLVEKQRTTPDAYPLTLNALRLACNQSTNRDPVVDYDDATIRTALERLARKRWARLASGQGSRAPKYRHLLTETLDLRGDELSVLATLMLRGTQTPGELKQRAERLHRFDGLTELEQTLERLAERRLVRRLERRPGQKEERYTQLLDRRDEVAEAPTSRAPEAALPAPPPVEPEPSAATDAEGGDRLGRLEEEVASLREEVASLRRRVEQLGDASERGEATAGRGLGSV